jgi:hypothetical protein
MDLDERLKDVGITPHSKASEDFIRFQAMIYTVLQARGYYLKSISFKDITSKERARLFYLAHGMWESLRDFEKS